MEEEGQGHRKTSLSTVTKKEESLLDFFRHSKRGSKEEGKEKGEQGEDWMDLEEETKGEVDAAELAKAAFGEGGAGSAEAITDNHSMGEPEESAGEGGPLETPNKEGRGSAEMTDYSLGGISEGDWKEIPQSGKSVATNYSWEVPQTVAAPRGAAPQPHSGANG